MDNLVKVGLFSPQSAHSSQSRVPSVVRGEREVREGRGRLGGADGMVE